jgi:hypothetical protein
MSNDNRGRRGEQGGKVSANKTTSAASIAKILKGIDFSANKNDLVKYAKQNKGHTEDSDEIIDTIGQLPEKEYNSMADVEHEVGQIE